MDTSQYLEIFIDETREHVQSLNEHLLILEKEPDNKDTINEIFRAAHSLKGMAGTMGFERMKRLTHDMENVFQEIRNDNMTVTSKLVDILFRGLDALEGYLKSVIETSTEGDNDCEDIIRGLKEMFNERTGNNPVSADVSATETKNDIPDTTGDEPIDDRISKITINEGEKTYINKLKDDGKNMIGITVRLIDTCILKSARAFLVFKALEDKGEVIKSLPTIEKIEDEEFDLEFSLIFATELSCEAVKKVILGVSEIKETIVTTYVTPQQIADGGDEYPVLDSKAVTAGSATSEQSKAGDKNQGKAVKSNSKHTGRSVRVDIEKLDTLMNLVSELIIAKNGLVSMNVLADTSDETAFKEQIEYLERVTTNLHESVMKVRMVPIESVVNRFPRMIRDISKKLDKKMELFMSGEETELDRTVIDEIGDPLMHLLRNSADHGLESNEDRIKAGKPEVGSIFLDAYQDGNNVVIEVRDDGAGINVEVIKRKAIEKGHITHEQAEKMSDKDAIELLFRPSFSTAEKVSDLSGRGVGLDVVRTNVESLGGSIEAKTELGVGSVFTIRLPLTLAIIQALMAEVGEEKYAIPLGSIQTIEDIPVSDIKFVQGKEVINLRGNVIPIIRLREVLDIETDDEGIENLTVVIVNKGDKQAGLVIDQLIGQQEIVIKSIGQYIKNVKMIGGATILGDGEVALILDVNALV
ncbi:MAG: chemotaxis protein CheA [Lachnospiraceae bacterium]|nr:chemotaxis protein CheA [Lachnospiraceae bacterium]